MHSGRMRTAHPLTVVPVGGGGEVVRSMTFPDPEGGEVVRSMGQ